MAILDVLKKKIERRACASVELCIEASNLCEKKGLLPLVSKGHQLAWNLQNPFCTKVPKLGIAVRDYPRNTIGLELLKTAESLTGLKPSQGSKDYFFIFFRNCG